MAPNYGNISYGASFDRKAMTSPANPLASPGTRNHFLNELQISSTVKNGVKGDDAKEVQEW